MFEISTETVFSVERRFYAQRMIRKKRRSAAGLNASRFAPDSARITLFCFLARTWPPADTRLYLALGFFHPFLLPTVRPWVPFDADQRIGRNRPVGEKWIERRD
jgi:hypothetical protein